uniref:tRNA(Ile)-lysidine synthase n=1 Tax=Synarthrophyton patena TaxID=48972 RepID=UPI0021820D0A|nr:tRNA(Ile)-lysidine synthase [Synarthrophyton patena]UVF63004.1 tRNA(Ile)-lysidine synthase [Synarthrophyton patena]
MHTFLHKRFQKDAIKLLKKNTGSLIAISGGQDSLCLIKLINDCFKNKRYYFEAIYIDHQWQKDSYKHTKHIANILNKIFMPITIYQIKEPVFSEEKAREIRYKILIQHALKKHLRYILTGHNDNDKTETFIQNLIRGSSLDGITGLNNKKKITHKLSIIRPLLNFNREEIRWFCRKFCLPIWSDASNYNYKIQRNRLRYELIPYLQHYFNPKFHEAINSFLYLCKINNEYIKENSIKLYMKSQHSRLISLNLIILQKQHSSLQSRIIQIYFYYHFNKSITKKCLKDIITIINKKTKINKIIYLDNLIIQKKHGWLYTNFRT